jgi:hypothetical protein
MLRRVALVGTDVSEEPGASFISMFLRNVGCYKSHTRVTSQKIPFFIVTAVKTSNIPEDCFISAESQE